MLGLSPDVVAGHSMGELVALWAAGCVEGGEGFMLPLIRETMEVMRREEESDQARYTLLAVGAGRESLAELIAAVGDERVSVAMDNCPRQTVLVGPPEPMATVEAELQRRRVLFERLPFHRPYHTPPVRADDPAGPRALSKLPLPARRGGRFTLCTTARPFPADPEAIRRELAIAALGRSGSASPELIRNLYDDGVRLFVESGSRRGNLSAFAEDVPGQRASFVAMPANVPRRSGLTQLNHLLGALLSHNVPLDLDPLYEHRAHRRLDWVPGTPASRRTLNAALPPERPRLDVPAAAPAPERSESTAHGPAGDLRSQVMARHLEVMGRFVDQQREITELFLTRTRRQREEHTPPSRSEHHRTDEEASRPPGRPLLGAFTHHEPGRTLVMRRILDLCEDHFATHHTVGGREISKVDPGQYGVPVMPMTFTLEMMAEAAAVLVPGLVVTSVRDVRLYRWLAYDEEAPHRRRASTPRPRGALWNRPYPWPRRGRGQGSRSRRPAQGDGVARRGGDGGPRGCVSPGPALPAVPPDQRTPVVALRRADLS